MNGEIRLLLHLLEEGYAKQTWHGPNLRGSLRGVTPQQASWRPASGRHNIWEILVHAAYWKYTVRRRLLGEKRGSFPLKGSNWFKRPDRIDRASLKADLRLLEDMHRSLHDAVRRMKPGSLHKRTSNSKFTNAHVIYGIAAHDIYHAGQIQLLKKLQRI